MDVKAKKTSPSPKEKEKKVLRYKLCFFVKGGATKEECNEINLDDECRERCRNWNCRSNWRYCDACVAHGTISEESEIGDSKEGKEASLCQTHLTMGPDFVIGKDQVTVVMYHPSDRQKLQKRKARPRPKRRSPRKKLRKRKFAKNNTPSGYRRGGFVSTS